MEIFGRTDIGLERELNEDSFFTYKINENTLFAIVCDGMGGANGGDVASNTAVDIISRKVLDNYSDSFNRDEIKNLIFESIYDANREIFNMAEKDSSLYGMGTTVVAVLVCNDVAYIANVGDSRCYLIQNGNATQVTEDHSVVQELVNRGEITKEQAKIHPIKNLITRAVGIEAKVLIDFIEIDFKDGDIILLCSDGLSNYFDDSNFGEISQKYVDDELTENYIKSALNGGGGDNVTVVIIKK